MMTEDRQLIESLLTKGEENREEGDWGAAKICYLQAMDELISRLEEDRKSGGTFIEEEDKALKKKIEDACIAIDGKLAIKHRDNGLSALKSKDYSLAVDELEEAINLGSEKDIVFLEEVKKHLDKSRVKEQDQKMFHEASPFVTRGDEFRLSDNFGEAILEYQEALKLLSGLPGSHRFVTYIHEVLKDCRRALVRPYLTSIYRATVAEKYQKANKILQRASLMIDETDLTYRAFFDQLREDVQKHITREDLVDDETDSPDEWNTAIRDYEEALNLYSSYTATDPLSPAYSSGNLYEDRFLKSRRNLAKLYVSRAERMASNAQVQKALRNYKEALKLFPKSDKDFHDTFRRIRSLRAQLTTQETAVGIEKPH